MKKSMKFTWLNNCTVLMPTVPPPPGLHYHPTVRESNYMSVKASERKMMKRLTYHAHGDQTEVWDTYTTLSPTAFILPVFFH